jgi:hypothetical protein
METKEQIEEQIAQLKNAYKLNFVTTNEYCETVHALYQKLKKITK